ncbi:MAG: cupredoxin domain-containing protein [Actinomycetota bacterium]
MMSIRILRHRIFVLLVLAAVLVAMLGGTALARQTIRARDNRFAPKRVSVSRNERVIWRNAGNNDHTVTAFGGGWSKDVRLDPGETTRFRFDQNGIYRYRCKIHANMDGRIRVG